MLFGVSASIYVVPRDIDVALRMSVGVWKCAFATPFQPTLVLRMP